MIHYQLVEPSLAYKDEYLNMISEWKSTGEHMVPFVLRFDCTDFDAFLSKIHELKTGPNLGENKVNSSTYLLVNEEGRVLGAANI